MLEVACSKCGKVRTMRERNTHQWMIRHNTNSIDNYYKENQCKHCASNWQGLLSGTQSQRIKCPRCGSYHTITGNAIHQWLQDHKNKTADDYYKEAPYCHRVFNERAKLGIGYKKNYRISCSKCGQTFTKTGSVLWAWINLNHINPPTNIFNEFICQHCSRRGKAKWLKSYKVTCPKCKQTRIAKAHAIISWYSYHNKSVDADIAKTINYYESQSLCKTCAPRRTPSPYISQGYKFVPLYPDDPYYNLALQRHSKHRKWRHSLPVAEHRYVMSQIIGRPLEPSESVHHRDGNKLNNEPSNLELRKLHHGAGASITPTSEEMLSRLEQLWKENKQLKELVNAK